MLACLDGNLEIVKILLNKGIEINAKNKNGWTSLMFACFNYTEYQAAIMHDYKNIVKLLIEHKADINIKNNEGKTALSIAKDRAYKEIVEILNNADAK